MYRLRTDATGCGDGAQVCLSVDGFTIGWIVFDDDGLTGTLALHSHTVIPQGSRMMREIDDFLRSLGWMIRLNGKWIGWS